MSSNALDSALVDLAKASTALERQARPGIKDVEEAKDAAKRAHGILDAAHKLLSVGIYTVADAPPEPGVPLFKPNGSPAVPPPPTAAVESIATLGYTEAEVIPQPADLLRSWPGWDAVEQQEQFDAQVAQIEDDDTRAHVLGVWQLGDKQRAYQTAIYVLALDEAIPEATEVADWVTKLIPDAFDAMSETQREELFFASLDKLEDAGLESDLALKDWKPAEKAWKKLWKEDPSKALRLVHVALDKAPISWSIPEEQAFVDPMEVEA